MAACSCKCASLFLHSGSTFCRLPCSAYFSDLFSQERTEDDFFGSFPHIFVNYLWDWFSLCRSSSGSSLPLAFGTCICDCRGCWLRDNSINPTQLFCSASPGVFSCPHSQRDIHSPLQQNHVLLKYSSPVLSFLFDVLTNRLSLFY
jgi:hypothetical protein